MHHKTLFLAALCLSAGAIGCADTVTADGADAAVDTAPADVQPIDVAPVDAPPPPDVIVQPDRPQPVDIAPVDARVPRCGDSVLDPGESCDDGNNVSGDRCSATCRFEARCGDMRVDMGEVCDDGNNASGDGCRSDCLSNETCGNRIVDTARGEVCDGTPGCGTDCRTIAMCGNSRVDPGEVCDDGNTTRWDGCGPDCRTEQAVVVTTLTIAEGDGATGCDFSGDGRPDNAFGTALGGAVGLLNSFITSSFSNGQVLVQLGFLNLTDPRGQNVPDARVGWLVGSDADMVMTNNGEPGNPQYVQRMSLDPMTLLPAASFQSRIAMGALAGGPEDVRLNLPAGPAGMLDFRVQRGRLSGTIVSDATRITGMRNGVLCGSIPARDLAALPNPAGLIPGGGGGGSRDGTFLELLVGGQRIVVFQIGPQQPDIDLDGDGLERIETVAGAGGARQISACVDGDGTRITGRMCANDPRIADGFTAAFQLQGTYISLRGAR
jgi:cysteine-rich repeat protein